MLKLQMITAHDQTPGIYRVRFHSFVRPNLMQDQIQIKVGRRKQGACTSAESYPSVTPGTKLGSTTPYFHLRFSWTPARKLI